MYLLPRRAFTLIELLTVIAIIGILAGILIPAVNRVRETARRSEAQTTVAEIETALNQYLAQYDRWPLMLSGTGELEVLVADPTSIFEGGTVRWTDGNESLFHSLTVIYAPDDFPFAPDQNRRRLILMTAGENRIFPSGANPETMVDPWGNEYSVAVDLTFSNRLDLSVIPSLELPLIRRNIAVWSYGGQPERTNRFIANFEVNPLMKSFPPYSRKAAFTLIELLTVIAIIAILAGLLFAVGAVRDSTRASRASAEIAAISTALVRFQVDFGFLPEVDFIPIVDDNGLEYAPQNAGNANAYRASSRALYFALQGLGYLPDEIPDGLEQTRRNRSLIDLSPSQFALTDDFSAGAPGPEIVVTLPPGNGGRDDRRIYEFPANFAAGPYLVDPWGFAYGYFLRDERFSPETPNLDQGQVSLHNYDTYDLWSVRDAAANRPSSRWVKNW